MTKSPFDPEANVLDEAARAGWLYYVGGQTQEQVAQELGISRQRAQRLVSRAVAEGLIHFRLEHKLAECLELEAALGRRFGLRFARVMPGLGPGADPVASIASAAAAEMERLLAAPEPIVMALGTGRSLRAAVESLRRMDCPQHKLVSLLGNIAPDGSASVYDVIMRIGDKVNAPHYPTPMPVIASSPEERDQFAALEPVRRWRQLAQSANVSVIGVGQMDDTAPIYTDGFISHDELQQMRRAGAVGEIVGWAFDSQGRYLEAGSNLRVSADPVMPDSASLVICIAAGAVKLPALNAALSGRLFNALITDTATAQALLG